jgi:hypothetical protein
MEGGCHHQEITDVLVIRHRDPHISPTTVEDEWTTLKSQDSRGARCLPSHRSIAGVGYSLSGVGAGEEHARKIVVGEASRCGDDKKAWFEGPGGQRGQVRAAWWQETAR